MSIRTMSVPTTQGNNLTLMPKLQNRFRVTFLFDNNEVVTGNVVSVTRPTLGFDDVEVHAYNSRIKMAGKHNWNDVSLVLRDDVSSQAVQALDAQINRQIDMASQSTPLAAASYKFVTSIETLDGTNGEAPGVLDQWYLVGTFIQQIEYGNNDYSTSDAVQITVNLRYDSAIHNIGGTDTLSGQFSQTGQIAATGPTDNTNTTAENESGTAGGTGTPL